MATHNVALTASYKMRASRLRLQQVIIWACSADIPAGSRLKIDPARQITTLDGVNIRGQVAGEFVFFNPGPAQLVYADAGAGRQIDLWLYWRGRWV